MTDTINEHHRFKDITKYGNNQLRYGTFGDVHISIDTNHVNNTISCNLTAIKTIRSATVFNENKLRKDVFNEVMALKLLSSGDGQGSENIINLNELFCDKNGMNASSLSLSFPYCPLDLATLLDLYHNHTFKDMEISEDVIRSLSRDLLLGLSYCISKGILHTDIKPGNLLINSQGILQIADFGLAKPCPTLLSHALPIHEQKYTDEAPTGLCTLYYRPPELLLGCNDYTPFIDIWSSALVIIEMLTLHPLFPGTTVIDQLTRIFRMLGTPNTNHFPNLTSYPDYSKINFTLWKPIELSMIIPRLYDSQDLSNLLTDMLKLDPFERPTASSCLNYSYFDSSQSYASRSHIVQKFIVPLDIQEPELLFKDYYENNAFNYAKYRAASIVSASTKLQKEVCHENISFDKSKKFISYSRSDDFVLRLFDE